MSKVLMSSVSPGQTLADLKRTFDRWGKSYSVTRGADRRTAILEFDFLGRSVRIPCTSQATYELNLRQLFLVADSLRIWDERGVMTSALGFFDQVKDLVRAQESQQAVELELLDAYGVLGVSPQTPLDVVEMAWKGWQKRLHPDLVQDPEERSRREEKLKTINEAWTIIKARAAKA